LISPPGGRRFHERSGTPGPFEKGRLPVNYFYGPYVNDGNKNFGYNTGRIVIYKDRILHAEGPSADHNYLLRSLAARYRINRDEVISGAARFYVTRESGRIIVSPVRKIDDDLFVQNRDAYTRLIVSVIK
jgi:hypothetical protein